MARDSQGRTFFANRSSGASTWTHPLEPSLRELAGVCRMCLTFPAALRESTISTLLETWQAEAKQELAKWYSVKHDNGREYYCHRETWEAMWEHPAEVVLPMHYLKIRSIERLRDEGYLTSLRNRDTVIKESPVPEAQAMTQKLTGVSIDTAAAESDAPTREATPKRDANSTSNRPVDQQAQQAPSGYPVDQKAEQQFSPQTTLAQPSGQIPLSQRTQGSVRRVPMSGTTSPEVTQTMYAKSKASTGRAPSREQSQGGQYQVRRMETPPQQMQKLREEAREHQLKEQQLRAELIEAKNQQLQTPQQLQALREEARQHQLMEQQLRSELIEAKNKQLQEVARAKDVAISAAGQHIISEEQLRSELVEAKQQHWQEVARSKDAAITAAEETRAQQSQLRDLEEVRRDLERQLGDATAAKTALQDELRLAEANLQAAGAAAQQRASQLEAELQQERHTTEEQAMDCENLSSGFRHALESVAEAERAKLFLEVRLAALYKDEVTRDSILNLQEDVNRAFLEAAYEEELGRRERLLAMDSGRQDMSRLLEQASARQAGLEQELEAAEMELRESRAVAMDFKEWTTNAEAELEQEREQARKTELAYEQLAAERSASERQRDELQDRLSQAEKELAGIQSSSGESAYLREQLAELSANAGAVQSEYEQAMQELSAAKAAGNDTKDRALQAEAQLLADRRNFDQALEQVRDAERARATLEAKLAIVEKGMEERDSLAARVHELSVELAEALSQGQKAAADEASADRGAGGAGDDRAQQLEEQLRQAEAQLQEAQERVEALGAEAAAQEAGRGAQAADWSARLEALQAQVATQAETAKASLERQKVDLAEARLQQSQAELERAAAERESLQTSLQAANAANASMAGLQAVLEREQDPRAGAGALGQGRGRRAPARGGAPEPGAGGAEAGAPGAGAGRGEGGGAQRSPVAPGEGAEQPAGVLHPAVAAGVAGHRGAADAGERMSMSVLEMKLQASQAAVEAAEKARAELTAQMQEEQRRQVAIARETGQLQAALEAQREVSERARERLAQLERLQDGSTEEKIKAQRELTEERMRVELAEYKLRESNAALAAVSSERAALQASLAEQQQRQQQLSARAAELEERLALEQRGAEAAERRLAGMEAESAKGAAERSALAVRLAEEEGLRASLQQNLASQRRISEQLSQGNAAEELTEMLTAEQTKHEGLQARVGSMEAQLEQERASLEAARARLGEAEAAAREAADSLAARTAAHAAEAAALESQLGQARRSAEALEQRLARLEADEEAQGSDRMRSLEGAEERVAGLRAELAEERERREAMSQQAAREGEERLAEVRSELAQEQRQQDRGS
ncbi:unnamed protein product [Prorocentrum cordatum]|uniref:WW domain-containing protein n=1 Tax=Prorocentrum cordatum TaxID=2364126 RepID=A0ABN9VFU0_9DINO|nr:unnamed protein product [Polarella glacialis]